MSFFPYAINVDWLQLFCHDDNDLDLDVTYNGRSSFEFKLRPNGSRHFKQIWDVVNSDGDNYAVIQRLPHSSIISARSAIIQLCNRELYRSFYVSELIIFMKTHHFRYKSMTRLDVCFDSNVLHNGLKHSSLIKGIMLQKYLKNKQGNVKWNFASIANVGRPMECNSCSFGSKTSAVSTKMYNKTLELKEVKNKPYIVENWRYNGLDAEQDVWRIEISIKSDAKDSIRISDGSIFRLNPDSLQLQKDVEDVFFSYADTYFCFKINDGKKNKTRMKDLQIFPTERRVTLRPLRITKEKDSTRSDRIFLKKLHSLFGNLPNMDYTTWAALWQVSNAFSLSRSLANWRSKTLLNEEDESIEVPEYPLTLKERLQSVFYDLIDEYGDESQELIDILKYILETLLNKQS